MLSLVQCVMDRLASKNVICDVAILVLVLVLSTSVTGEPQAQPVPPTKPLPEIVALLPSGQYIGQGQKGARAFDVSLVVHESKPGGKFTGTIVAPQAAVCADTFPINGEMKPNGVVHIDSRGGVAKGCERTLNLKLAGNELSGALIDAEGTYQVKLKRQ